METHLQELNDKRGNIFNTMRTQGYFKGSKRGRYRGGTTAITPSLWGWMGQSVIQQTFNWTLMWARNCAGFLSFCFSGYIWILSCSFSLSLLLVLSDILWKQPKQTVPIHNVPLCLLKSSACRSIKFLSLNSKLQEKRIQGADWVGLLQSSSWVGPGTKSPVSLPSQQGWEKPTLWRQHRQSHQVETRWRRHR